MGELPEFRSNETPTLGVELELMLIDPQSGDLTAAAVGVQQASESMGFGDQIKLEITQSMIELNSSVHETHGTLHEELKTIGLAVTGAAHDRGARICGGGTHPFHRWQERQISPHERFQEVAWQYGYLAKQFTVFGQHVHVGCENGDDAIAAIHLLSLYVPHFIALSGASPFSRGVDTGFDSCRLNMIAAFPLSGRMPTVHTWEEFEAFFSRLKRMGVVNSIKDLYWDIRPKPEFGTVEVRVADTPLDVTSAADLAAYIQVLTRWTREMDMPEWLDDYVYRHNRFQAARFGYDGRIIVGPLGERQSVYEHLRFTLEQVAPVAADLRCGTAIERLREKVLNGTNDASWLRNRFQGGALLPQVVALTCDHWSESLS